jgi:hypothetical protein
MSRRQLSLILALSALLLAASLSAPAFPAQEPEAGAEPPAAPAGAQAAQGGAPSVESTVERILREQEAVLRGQLFSYEPGGRRDPFQSLLSPHLIEGERPPGVAGMLVTELDLAGVVRDAADGDVAMVIGSDNKGYFLRVGDAVFDGTVIGVDPQRGTVTFRQQVEDPRSIKPYRDVVKRLVPLEENSNE